MNRSTLHPPSFPLRQALVLAWAWLFLLAQAAALAHGVMHGAWGEAHHRHAGHHVHDHGSGRAAAGDPHHVQHVHHAHAGADSHWMLQVVHGNGNDACKLFDAAGHAVLPQPARVTEAPLLPGGAVLAVLDGDALARWAALFDARGPPASS